MSDSQRPQLVDARITNKKTLAERIASLTPAQRALFERQQHVDGAKKDKSRIPRREDPRPWPASIDQTALWFIQQLDPSTSSYNIGNGFHLKGKLDLPLLEQALNLVVQRHEILRTTFVAIDGKPYQFVQDCRLRVTVTDVRNEPDPEPAAHAMAAKIIKEPFDLERGPLVRLPLVRFSDDDYILVGLLHHIVTDWWSYHLFFSELFSTYSALVQGRFNPLPELPIQYADWAAWRDQWENSEEFKQQEKYWIGTLEGVSHILEVPADRKRPLVQSDSGAREFFDVPESIAEKVRRMNSRANVSSFMTFLAAINVFLWRYTGQRQFLIGTPVSADRDTESTAKLIGYMLNTLLLRADLSGDPTFRTVLDRVRNTCIGALGHKEYPFRRLVERLNPERQTSRMPLYQVEYVYTSAESPFQRTASEGRFELPGCRVIPLLIDRKTSPVDLQIVFTGARNIFKCMIEYNTDIFDPPTIRQIGDQMVRLLETLLNEPERPISTIALLSQQERHRILREFNSPSCEVPEKTIAGLFEEQVARSDSADAVIVGHNSVSYRELNERSNRLAYYLIRTGIGPEHLVGILLPRSIELVVALLGILKAGAAYLPLDTDSPPARIAQVIDDARPRSILTIDQLHNKLPPSTPTVLLDENQTRDAVGCSPARDPGQTDRRSCLRPDSAAYVIYTSGSTGRPKGVVIEQRNTISFVSWAARAFNAAQRSGVLASTSLCFDLSVFELLATLINGGIVILAESVTDLQHLPARDKVRSLNTVPSLAKSLADSNGVTSEIRTVTLAGEVVQNSLVQQLYGLGHIDAVYNLYGPTETTTYSTMALCPAGAVEDPTIGVPISNTQAYVLDEHLELLPIGVTGELYLVGPGVARGYLNCPDRTAEKFLPNPYAACSGARMYRTGDLVRWLRDGQLKFIARADRQLKIRGLRIEPGEIEAALLAHADVRQAAVIGRDGVNGGRELAAYVCLASEATVDVGDLSIWLKNRLPGYMVPSVIVRVSALPLKANGKLDIAALPSPTRQAKKYRAPRTAKEKVLAGIFKEALHLPQIGLDDNFFNLGGDSILSLQVIARARKEGLILAPRDVFQQKTVEDLARVAANTDEEPGWREEPESAVGEVIATPIMRLFMEGAGPLKHFCHSVSLRVPAALREADLVRVVQSLIDTHDTLRLRIDGENRLHISEAGSIDAHAALSSVERSTPQVIKEMVEKARSRLDPALGIMLQAIWLIDRRLVILVVHHFSIDGVSWRILQSDFSSACEAVTSGRELRIEKPPISFRSWAQSLAHHARTPAVEDELPIWEATLGRGGHLLQSAVLDPTEDTISSARSLHNALSESVTTSILTTLPAAFHAGVNDVLLAAMSISAAAFQRSRMGQSVPLLIDVEGHGREGISVNMDLSRTVGWFTTMFPVVLDAEDIDLDDALSGGKALDYAIKRVKEQLRSSTRNGLGYGLLRYLNPQAGIRLKKLPSPQIVFNYLGRFDNFGNTDDSDVERTPPLVGSADRNMALQHPLEINAWTVDGPIGPRLCTNWTWATRHMNEKDIEDLSGLWHQALKAMSERVETQAIGGHTPSDFPMLSLSGPEVELLDVTYPNLETALPLSPLQEGILFESGYDEGAADAYIVQIAVEFHGVPDKDRLSTAIRELLRRHRILRAAVFHTGLKHPVQVIGPIFEPLWREEDFSSLTPSKRDESLRQLQIEERRKRFVLAVAPLFRQALVRIEADRSVLVFTFHHILMDGWSMAVFIRELFTLYQSAGAAAVLSRTHSFEDYLAWLFSREQAPALEVWKEHLAGIDGPTRLIESAKRTHPSEVMECREIDLPCELAAGVNTLSRELNITSNTVLQGLWAILLSKFTCRDDIVFGFTVSGRPAELENVDQTVGPLINTLPLRVKVAPSKTISALLAEIHASQAKLLSVHHVGLADIQNAVGVGGLFDTLMVFENYPVDPNVSGQALAHNLHVTRLQSWDASHYPLTLIAIPRDGMRLQLSYDSARLTKAFVESVSECLVQLIRLAITNPETRICSLDVLKEAKKQQFLLRGNSNEQKSPPEETLPRLFERQALRRPEATAVLSDGDGDALSYRQLNERANQLARYLRARSVGAETLVGVCMKRSPNLLVAVLGILKAGAAYVPLDPSYPDERRTFMMEDAGIDALLTEAGLDQVVPRQAGRPIRIDADWDQIALGATDNLGVQLWPTNVAYVMYTSGSTGSPKGIMVSHHSIASLVLNTDYLQICESDRVAQVSNYSFDAATFEIWGALLNGACLIMMDKETVLSPRALGSRLSDERVSVMLLTTALFNQTAREAPEAFDGLRCLLFGGEAADPTSVQKIIDRAPTCLTHVYGPTETTTLATWFQVREIKAGATTVPIGAPIANMKAYVLDRNLDPAPVEAVGELYLAGAGLARGYLGAPELTAERFIADPYGESFGGRMYRTGDLVRLRTDQALEFVGRNDRQLKIRGFRVELEEIEAALKADSNVQDALVVARKDGHSETYLTGYVLLHSGAAADGGMIRRNLKKTLPEYMVPSSVMVLPAWPLTENGKVDRERLPEPEKHIDDEYRAPRSPSEEMLCEMFAEVLGRPSVGIDDDFFALGGHSLMATRLVSRIRATLGIELSLRDVFECSTVSHLATQLEKGCKARPQLVAMCRPEQVPLSYAQQRLWFIDQIEGKSAQYNMPEALRLRGELNATALERAVNTIIDRHENLRTHFEEVDGEPRQVITPSLRVEVPIEDISELDQSQSSEFVATALRREWQQPFDLARGPLLRIKLIKLGEREHILLRTFHHIVADGWSQGVFNREFGALYETFCEGRENPLKPLSIQYADFALWQRRYFDKAFSEDLKYWSEELAGIPVPLTLPLDRSRPPIQSFAADFCRASLGVESLAKLKQLGQASHVTLYMSLLAVFAILLQRYSGESDIVVGSPIANRKESQLESLIGFFVNSLMMRIQVDPQKSFHELLQSVRKITLDAYEHQDLPFERLVEELSPERNLATTPLHQIVFALQNAPSGSLQLKGLEITSVVGTELKVRFDLELHAVEREDQVEFYWIYNRDLFDRWRVEQMARHYLRLLEAAVAVPNLPLCNLSLLATEERRLLTGTFNALSGQEVDPLIPTLFIRQANQTPDAIAIECGEERITYFELRKRAEALARLLRERGVGPDVRIGVCAELSSHMIVGLLSVLLAGGAYVPLAPDYPIDRLKYMVADSDVRIVLATEEQFSLAREIGSEPVLLEDNNSVPRNKTDDLPPLHPSQLAYVIYTSGSTGLPKGVGVTHGNLAHSTAARCNQYGPTATEFLMLSSFAFDSSVAGIFWTLAHGGTLHVPHDGELRDVQALAGQVEREKITHLLCLPSLYREILEVDPGLNLSSLRTVIVAGEVCEPDLIRRHYEILPDAELYNEYGPTEATVWSTVQQCVCGENRERVPIGKPIRNTRVYVVDGNMQLVPIGVTGELCIAGPGVTRGYLKQADATAAKFIPSPFGPRGQRIYRTGDQVRWLPNGSLEFVGRQDSQVKIRGYRIELNEIEEVLKTHSEVEDAVVVMREQADQKRLVGYVIARRQGTELDSTSRHLDEWRDMYESIYQQNISAQADNTVGWVSRFTDEPIPKEEMGEWVEETMQRLRTLKPTRVLDVGCGTGLLLNRLAGECESYTGVDFSNTVIASLGDYVRQRDDLKHVALRVGTAHDLSFVRDNSVDLTILNSVVQYFSNVDYLSLVLKEAVRVTRPGGHIFVGDVRSRALLAAYHASLQLCKSENERPMSDIRDAAVVAQQDERELVLDPALFTRISTQWEKIGRVESSLKTGTINNEMTCFRYDVTLTLGKKEVVAEPDIWLPWDRMGEWERNLRQTLKSNPHLSVGVRGFPDSRLASSVKLGRLLQGPVCDISDAAQLRSTCGTGIGDHPRIAVECALSLKVQLVWQNFDSRAVYDLVFNPCWQEAKPAAHVYENFQAYANTPVHRNCDVDWTENLRDYLRGKLPEYMVPSAIVKVPSWPTLPNGKIDRTALPEEKSGHEVSRIPATPMEDELAKIWSSVLGVQQIQSEDNFFDLGGHSLLIPKVRFRIREKLKQDIPTVDFFMFPTLQTLAQRIERPKTNRADFADSNNRAVGLRKFLNQRSWAGQQQAPSKSFQ